MIPDPRLLRKVDFMSIQPSARGGMRHDDEVLAAIVPLRDAGFALHWLHPRTKRPIGKLWQQAPVASLDDLRRTYSAGNNLGVRLGEPSLIAASWYLHVLDMDIRIADLADEAWGALRALLPVDPDTLPMVESGSGGESRHLYFVSDRPFYGKKLALSEGKHRKFDPEKGRDVWHHDWEIELFGTGKQVAMPPSIHPDTGKPYRWVREFDFFMLALDVAPIIDGDAIEAMGAASTTAYAYEARDPLTYKPGQLDAVLRDIPLDRIDDRNDWVMLGQALHHQFGGSDEGFRLWMDVSRRSSKFLVGSNEATELRRYRGFGRNRRQPVTMATVNSWAQEARVAALVDEFDDIYDDDEGDVRSTDATDESTSDDDLPDFESMLGDVPAVKEDTAAPVDTDNSAELRAMNKRHALVMAGSGALIAVTPSDRPPSFWQVRAFHEFHANRFLTVTDAASGKPKQVARSRVWLTWSKRRTYPNGIIFAPDGGDDRAFNLWRGWAVEPEGEASCALFLFHIRDVVCAGDPALATYLLGYLAYLVQHPAEKPGVALVLRGLKGTGKDVVGRYLARMIGRQHVVNIAQSDHLLGKFNEHLQAALLVHVEEAIWAGSKAGESALKNLITAPTMTIERKGVDAYQAKTCFRILMSSNETWTVPASADERRFAVFDVSPKRRGDADYFERLHEEMAGDGPAALLHFLKTYDLSGFNVRKAPESKGLRDQKLESLRGVERWWFSRLFRGDLLEGWRDASDWTASCQVVARDALRGQYADWAKERRFDGEVVEERQFGRRLREIVPALQDKRSRADGGASRVWQYIVPPLQECREGFERWLGSAIDWD